MHVGDGSSSLFTEREGKVDLVESADFVVVDAIGRDEAR
jgi:phage anti-repressor protein